jgi:hypothetical protein
VDDTYMIPVVRGEVWLAADLADALKKSILLARDAHPEISESLGFLAEQAGEVAEGLVDLREH